MARSEETVTEVTHWSNKTFSFKTTKNTEFNFRTGEFTMMGMMINGKRIMRAYSMASTKHDEYLEWISIKLDDGPLTSQLQKIKVGDTILINDKSTGTLVNDHLLSGRNLYLISTGTGIAPFLGIIKDEETYQKFSHVVLTHTVQYEDELIYREHLENLKPAGKFTYFNTLTQQDWSRTGRITNWIKDNRLWQETGNEQFDPAQDRMMICGSMALNKDIVDWLNGIGATEGNNKQQGTYVVEKAFVG